MEKGEMSTKLAKPCQLYGLETMAIPLRRRDIVWQLRKRVKRMTQRRWNYVVNIISQIVSKNPVAADCDIDPGTNHTQLNPGDIVRVRSREEIKQSLSPWNELRGCGFMDEMFQYCNTRQRVLKKVEKFLDERDYLVKKTSGIIILENVICGGTKAFGPCDRSCFYFWREEWLEKVE